MCSEHPGDYVHGSSLKSHYKSSSKRSRSRHHPGGEDDHKSRKPRKEDSHERKLYDRIGELKADLKYWKNMCFDSEDDLKDSRSETVQALVRYGELEDDFRDAQLELLEQGDPAPNGQYQLELQRLRQESEDLKRRMDSQGERNGFGNQGQRWGGAAGMPMHGNQRISPGAIRQENEELKRRNQALEAELNSTQTHLQQSTAENSRVNSLLTTRTMELKGAQTFLSKADLFSVGDVKRMLNTLNVEIFQCSCWIAEKVFASPNDLGSGSIDKEQLDVVDRHIGNRMRSSLQKSLVTGKASLLLQLALQVVLVSHCKKVLERFDPRNDATDMAFQEAYRSICAKEDAAVAGRWRALTIAQFTQGRNFDFDASAVPSVIMAVVCIGGGSDNPGTALAQSIKEHLEPIEKALNILKHAVSQGITSMELLPQVWPCEHPYDKSMMQAEYLEGKKVDHGKLNGQPIGGTIDLGLQSVTTIRRQDGSLERRTDIAVLPKVVLSETLAEIVDDSDDGN
ncbi:hypothetical protein FA15DRAFT_110723 [Coprinopsis marcescibilis]|uniref:Uncharacterized protein n=1 Tax=Coprinopsis marcescibilis TaxID=230819 RepID=A0A5C3KKU0_COPMA|nr:hypothetical protein FA15DRAFT_110723 [Coprinopsis marcescibilis]